MAATEVTNELAQRFACQRVSLGFVRYSRVRIEAMSHSSRIDQNSSRVRAIRDAMSECLDQQATVVYPAGRPRADRDGMAGWHGFRDNDENGDLAFVDDLMTALEQRYRVDHERVYVTGFSNGGGMAGRLACELGGEGLT